MRKSCYECVVKHLGSAGVFIKETKMGYPDYDVWAIGELEHAADECLEANQDLALTIREHRLKWMHDKSHRIPIEEMNRYIKTCMLAQESGIKEPPAIPDDLYEGLVTKETGSPVFHGDTRPQGQI